MKLRQVWLLLLSAKVLTAASDDNGDADFGDVIISHNVSMVTFVTMPKTR